MKFILYDYEEKSNENQNKRRSGEEGRQGRGQEDEEAQGWQLLWDCGFGI